MVTDNKVTNKVEGEFTNSLFQFLKECKLVSYYPKFKEYGYNDLEQLKDMTAEELNEMMNDVGMEEKLKGHRKRLESSLSILKSKDLNPPTPVNKNISVQGSSKNSDVLSKSSSKCT